MIHDLFVTHRSMSVVARLLGLSQIRVREGLVQYERNKLRDVGLSPPPLREMLRGDVTTRFGVARSEFGGRPAKHLRKAGVRRLPGEGTMPIVSGVVTRVIVTAAEGATPVHQAFWQNLQAYAACLGARLMVVRVGHGFNSCDMMSQSDFLVRGNAIDLAGCIDIAVDQPLPPRSGRPLQATQHRRAAQWTVFPHPDICLETLTRVRSEGLRVHLTTGAVTMPTTGGGRDRREVGAVIAEVAADGGAYCRHLTAAAEGDGAFQDLDVLVTGGVVRRGCRAEAICFGDIHHVHMDPRVASATWGIGQSRRGIALVDHLRPRAMVFHDVCDFEARNAHDERDHLKRFAQFASGRGDVAAELAAAARFLRDTRRKDCDSFVVSSNHDDGLVRWLREADHRTDPLNALFYLEANLDLHRTLAASASADGFFGRTLRRLSDDGLAGVRFLGRGEGLRIADAEVGMHGHLGSDGRPGSVRYFESLGIRATLGHTHRPVTRGGIYCTGVCQTELHYARGPLTSWASSHVVAYPTGGRQHLFLIGDAFHA